MITTAQTNWLRMAGSALAGAIGFGIGLYAGFFLILSIWGLEADSVAFIIFTTMFGSLFAAAALALTIPSSERARAFVVTPALGAVVMMVLLATDGGFDGVLIGGVVLAVVAAIVVHLATDSR